MQLQKQKMRVSIVIPAYNEADTIGACLDAIAVQTVKPFEVIVVDNNSTDDTAKIAGIYPFVKVIHEPRQGVIHARRTGFDSAHGEIIGRIDCDTLLSENWVETVQHIFSNRSIDAVSGSATYSDVAFSRIANGIDLIFRRYLARRMGRMVALQGANMAMRRNVWKKVKGSLCETGGMHEDLDFSVHAAEMGFKLAFREELVAGLGFRQGNSSYRDFCTYVMLNPRTYSLHNLKIQRVMYPVITLAIICFPLIKIAQRGYDPVTQGFSFERLLLSAPDQPRVNPATFVE